MSDSIGRALAAPLAVLVMIPLLVLGTGLAIGYKAYSVAHQTVHDLAGERFRDRAAMAERDTVACLGQVEPLLAAARGFLSRHGDDFPIDRYAQLMSAIVRDRPGVAFAGFGDPAGHYVAVFLDRGSGEWRLTDRRIRLGRTIHRDYRLVGSGLEQVHENRDSGFDPRLRTWYTGAVDAGERIWTAPYIWYASRHPGITCAEPVYRDDGSLLGVITVDFDFDGMSSFVAALGDRETQTSTVIVTAKKELVAYPGLVWEELVPTIDEERVPMLWDMRDPIADAVLDAVAGRRFAEETEVQLEIAGRPYLASVHRLPAAVGVDWLVITVGSLHGLLGPAGETLDHSITVSVMAVISALIIALLFALHLVRTDRRARRAEQDARRARAKVDRMGAYRLLRLLGEGGMGEVWLGEHSLLKRPVAVKLVHSLDREFDDEDDRQRAIARLQREARTLAKLNARNTIEIYDFGVTDEGEFFYVMELLDGVDLHDLVARFGVPPLGRVVSILEQAAMSLAEAHESDLVHRDIKPANIYLCRIADELDVVKVLDFGMVRSFDAQAEARLTIQGTIEGTPAYMAPEQAQDKSAIDGRADLYSLACVAVYLLTGHELYQRETPMAVLVAHVSEPIPDLRELGARIPDELHALLRRCLAKMPEDRPADMQAFIEALRSIPVPEGQRWTPASRRAWWAPIPRPRVEAEDPGAIRALRPRES